MDSLSHLIALLAPKGVVDLRCRFSSNWTEHHPQAEAGRAPYHVILGGQGQLVRDHREWFLAPGDVLLFPRGESSSAHRTDRRWAANLTQQAI